MAAESSEINLEKDPGSGKLGPGSEPCAAGSAAGPRRPVALPPAYVPPIRRKRILSYATGRQLIADADLLLFRRRGLISIAGRGIHGHAARAVWARGILLCCEMRFFSGGRPTLLSQAVRAWPGRIDVYRPNPKNRWRQYDAGAAADWMLRLAGRDYGLRGLLGAAARHVPIVRLFLPPDVDDRAIDRRPPFCSQACVMADRLGGGVDPVPNLADRLVEPADLARSPFYEYLWTLIP